MKPSPLTLLTSHSHPSTHSAGYTRSELLTTLAGVSILAFVSIPLLGTDRMHGQLARCVANLRTAQQAWSLYAADHDGRVVGASSGIQQQGFGPDWAAGVWLDFNPGEHNWDPARFPGNSPLKPYAGPDPQVFHCPADPSSVSTGVREDGSPIRRPRTRSFAINAWAGAPGWQGSGVQWHTPASLSEFIAPGPAETFTFIDEREESINDGFFGLDMRGYSESGISSAILYMVDFPADWHDQSAAVAFVDGHVEVHRWLDPRTTPPHHGTLFPLNVPSPHNADVIWLQDHATRARIPH
jgi:prepilin-type processing-associated H-X9-DG protein